MKLTTNVEYFNEFQFPVKFGTENLNYFRGEYLDSGNSLNALKSSISLEVFFEPFKKNGNYYSDIGVSDLYVRNPQELFSTDKNFLLRISPKLNYDPKRNFRNIINVLYGTIDIGGYYANGLYSADKINYDDIFELKINSDIDPKTFYNSIGLYNEGYYEGKKFVGENNVFDKNKIKPKKYNFKKIDYENLYTSIRTENYFSKRDFYYTFKIDPVFDNNFFNFYLYSEYLNFRLCSGIKMDYDFKYKPFIDLKQYYFPFKVNRIDLYYNFKDNFDLKFRTYLVEKFRNIYFIDLGYNYKNNFSYYTFSANYDNIYYNILKEEGISVSLNNYFDFKKCDFDYKFNFAGNIKNILFNNTIGYYRNNNFQNISETIYKNDFKNKIYILNNLKYKLLKNINLDISQIMFLNDLYINFEYNFYVDDFFYFGNNYGANIEFPFSFIGVTNFDVKIGFLKNKLYIYFNK